MSVVKKSIEKESLKKVKGNKENTMKKQEEVKTLNIETNKKTVTVESVNRTIELVEFDKKEYYKLSLFYPVDGATQTKNKATVFKAVADDKTGKICITNGNRQYSMYNTDLYYKEVEPVKEVKQQDNTPVVTLETLNNLIATYEKRVKSAKGEEKEKYKKELKMLEEKAFKLATGV